LTSAKRLEFTDVKHDLVIEQDLEIKARDQQLQEDGDFEVWVDKIHDELEYATFQKYLYTILVVMLIDSGYRAVLEARLHTCNKIASHASALLVTLDKLKDGFMAVAAESTSFQATCDPLIQEEVLLRF